MSHTTELEVDFNDHDSLRYAVTEVGGTFLGAISVNLFDGKQIAADAAFELPDWKYPVAVKDGKLYFDNYNGRWGKNETLDKVRQGYARNVSVKTLKARGYRVTEHVENGHIRLRATR